MKRVFHWLDENLEEFLLVIGLIAMTLIMGIQVFCRYVLGMSLSWSEELTRYIFIWCGFLSVSYCSKKCLSINIHGLHTQDGICCDMLHGYGVLFIFCFRESL